jgi:hypothetical protein
MPVEVVLGLPYLSDGPLTRTARRLDASVLVSASAFSKQTDFGPVPERWLSDAQRTGRTRRMKEWSGWNTSQLRHAHGLAAIDLDSAGFVAMALKNGYEWTVRQYVETLCTAHPWRRFSSMDMCVEPEVARNRDEVRERMAKTAALNRECRLVAADCGIEDRLMHVIQGSTPDDYLRCFDMISDMVPDDAVVGVGSMCRRQTGGDDGIVAVVERLHAALPDGVRLHLFGLKSDGAEAVAMLDGRVASIDSQAYGVRARRIANDERRRDPSFSKSNEMVASVMETWWTGQVARMARGSSAALQACLPMPSTPEPAPRTVWEALRLRARAETNAMILDGDLDWCEMVSERAVEEHAQILSDDLPDDVLWSDPYTGLHQLPESVRENFPCVVPIQDLHRSIRPATNPPISPEPSPLDMAA